MFNNFLIIILIIILMIIFNNNNNLIYSISFNKNLKIDTFVNENVENIKKPVKKRKRTELVELVDDKIDNFDKIDISLFKNLQISKLKKFTFSLKDIKTSKKNDIKRKITNLIQKPLLYQYLYFIDDFHYEKLYLLDDFDLIRRILLLRIFATDYYYFEEFPLKKLNYIYCRWIDFVFIKNTKQIIEIIQNSLVDLVEFDNNNNEFIQLVYENINPYEKFNELIDFYEFNNISCVN